ncbi:DoxX-like family protein [Streptomyces sp. TLI_053]|uniref:DoxX family protein n=1 Tax=Streptomyces sp. TLI_053 TaxID=1855352 RepID=UPI00087DDD2B|nr:DoxX family protein [Streptomyces sp. TLI_053]SDT80628.1 DoxX-like family protein [Streptomyces sp. TLI_053]
MDIAYWTVAGPLALFYLYAGTLKAIRSPEQLRPMMAWVDRIPVPALRALGTVEVLAAAGLVLPPLTGVAVSLAGVAAAGLVVLQAGAIAVHLTGGDRRIALNIGLVTGAAAAVRLAAGL